MFTRRICRPPYCTFAHQVSPRWLNWQPRYNDITPCRVLKICVTYVVVAKIKYSRITFVLFNDNIQLSERIITICITWCCHVSIHYLFFNPIVFFWMIDWSIRCWPLLFHGIAKLSPVMLLYKGNLPVNGGLSHKEKLISLMYYS